MIQRNVRLVSKESEKGKVGFYYENSWALIVGIDDYADRHPKLKNACNDARAFANTLKTKFGFENITTLLDEQASRDDIMGYLVENYPDKIEPNDRLLFFFAGHGDTRIDKHDSTTKYGYIVPQDAPYKRYAKYIPMDEINKACGVISAKHILIILDCCFSGVATLFADPKRGSPPDEKSKDYSYLRRITEMAAWQILTAGTADEAVADSGQRPGHSVFTSAILEGLDGSADQDNNLIITASELSNYVKLRVIEETSNRGATVQTPLFNYIRGTKIGGDFVFMLPGYKSGVELPEKIENKMQDKHYPEYISERIFLVHSWKLAPFSGEDHEKYYNVRVWLDAYQDSDLEDITRVTYRLYDDFSQKVIATESKKKNFEILLTIWGEFTVVAYVEREGKSPLLLTRYLDVPGSFESVHRPSEGEEPKSYIV